MQGLFRIVQGHLDLSLCLIFQTEGSKWYGLCFTLGIILVGSSTWRRKDGDEEGGGSHALPSQLQGVLEEIPCVAATSDRRTPVEILIRGLEYRRRHSCEPGDLFWSSTAKCESPTPAWVENRIIQHPCYPWYAVQTSWRTKVNLLLALFCDIASDLAQNPVRFLHESCQTWESLTEGLLGPSTGSVTFGECTLNFQSLPNHKWHIFWWPHQNIRRKLQLHLVMVSVTPLVAPLLFADRWDHSIAPPPTNTDAKEGPSGLPAQVAMQTDLTQAINTLYTAKKAYSASNLPPRPMSRPTQWKPQRAPDAPHDKTHYWPMLLYK